ncbi:MAG: hypothetical protein ACE37B_14940 [Ilumatobacter sp.]|uniref:hypothetical protein n=1 Tax=Ilumatobacter sp. TaxID=1967498 RepID=UPI00391CA2A4
MSGFPDRSHKLSVTASGLASAAVAAAFAGPGIRSIGQIAEGAPGSLVQTGPFGSQLHASDYVSEGVPTFMPTDIANGRLDIAGAAKITESKANELGRHRLRSGDLLFGRRGDLSRCAVVPDGAAGGLCGTGCLLVRIPNNVIAADWLALVYRHDYVQRQVLGRAVGSTMLNLSGGLIRSLLVPLPTEESEQLMAAFRSNEQRLEAESNQHSKLRELRRGLASDLLSGRVRTVKA